MSVRVRLKFDATPVNYARKCWFTFDSEKCRLVRDVAHLIASHFGLQAAHGIQLYMEDYLVPTNESIQVIRDGDLIEVRTVQASELSSTSSSEDESPAKPPASKRPKKGEECGASLPNASPKVKPLVGITKRTASGGLHTLFGPTSSSSSSSSSESSDSSASEGSPDKAESQAPPPLGRSTQWDVKKRTQLPTTSSKPLKKGVGSSRSVPGLLKKVASFRKGRRIRRKGAPPGGDVVVGGPKDILTTRSKVYTRSSKDKGGRETETVGGEVDGVDGEGEGESSSEDGDGSGNGMETASPIVETVQDYSSYPDLQGPPRVGDKLAFKVLELSSNYTPEVSQFMEGSVQNFDPDTTTVKLKYSGATLARLSQKLANKDTGKFSLDVSDETSEPEDSSPVELKEEVSLPLIELLEPKLLPQNTV